MDGSDLMIVLEAKHRKEKKELQAQIQALKKAAKNDKTKKKEITAEIARLEYELELRQKQELEEKQEIDSHEKDFCLDSQTDDVSEVVKLKVSKAQKRRDKKALLDKERAVDIKKQEEENINGPRNMEIQAITAKLKERGLYLHHIPSDGDCLYQAVVHQLAIRKQQNFTVSELRQNVANHIKNNKNDFIVFMSNQHTGEVITNQEFLEYCDKIRDTKVWGGQLEIRALSNCLKCPITIIQATGPDSIEQGIEYDGPPLVITYHRHMYSLGEHYNSTQCLTEVEKLEDP